MSSLEKRRRSISRRRSWRGGSSTNE